MASTITHDNSNTNMEQELREQLTEHFTLSEFCNYEKYPGNKPTQLQRFNMLYGCVMILEPARKIAGPIIINSGFRNPKINKRVGGVSNSQHLDGCAADITTKYESQFPKLVEFLKADKEVDQLLTGSNWLHVSWNPWGPPRHDIRIGYYR